MRSNFRDKQKIEAKYIVVTGSLDKFYNNKKTIKYNSSKTIYFSTSINIKNSNYITLFPNDELINNIAVPTSISSSYSNNGDALLSISITDSDFSKEELIPVIKSKLSNYYGGKDSEYIFLKFFDLKKATIKQNSGFFDKEVKNGKNLIFAGEHIINGSIEGAIQSGKQAAQKIYKMENKI